MKIKQSELNNNIGKLSLEGSLDIQGTSIAELPLSVASGKYDNLIVDFSKVEFLASIGVRIIVKSAKTLSLKGGKLAIIKPNDMCLKVIKSTGIDALVPIAEDEDAAIIAVS